MTYVTDLRWEKEINQIPTLSATVWDPTTAEKALLIEGNDVRVTAAGTEVWYGQIRSIKDDRYGDRRLVRALGKEVIIQDRAWNLRSRIGPVAAGIVVDELLASNEREPRHGQQLLWDMATLDADGKMEDLSEKGNAGTITGTTSVPGKWGLARDFPNSTDKILSGSSSWSANDPFSVAWFIKPDASPPADNSFMVCNHTDGSNGFRIAVTFSTAGGAQINVWVSIGTGAVLTSYGHVIFIDPGRYTHIAVTWNPSTTDIKWYKDGVLLNTTTHSGGWANTSLPFQTGEKSPGHGTTFHGHAIDELYVYNRVLAATEIQLLAGLRYVLAGGLLADAFSDVAIDTAPQDRLTLVDTIAKAIRGEWYVDRDGSDQDRFRFVARRGSASPTQTFTLETNIAEIDRRIDRETVRNDITMVGAGDGADQLRSRNFHATTIRTTLTADYSAGATSALPVTDSSAFPTSGIVFVGMERIRYSGKAAGQLGTTSVTRAYAGDGQSSYGAYAHTKGLEVAIHADETTTPATYYTPEAPQTGSSIQVNGWRQARLTDRAITDQDSLDRMAYGVNIAFRSARESLRILVPVETMTAVIGDDVNVNEKGGGGYETTPYRVVAVAFARDSSMWTLGLDSPRDIDEALLALIEEDVRKSGSSEQGYVQWTGVASVSRQVSVSASTTETTVVTRTIRGYALAAGAVVRIHAGGTYDNPSDASPTAVTFRVKVGGTTVLALQATPPATTAQTGKAWFLSALVTVRAAGVVGKVIANGSLASRIDTTLAGSSDVQVGAETSVDLSKDQAIAVTMQLGEATSGYVVRADDALIAVDRDPRKRTPQAVV